MGDGLYEQSSVLICAVLFAGLVLAIEVGYRVGRLAQGAATDSSKAHINTVQASLLGVLALLLGFTFSLSLERYDKRSDAVVDEANAIGTAYLRAELLPVSVRGDVRRLLRHYLHLRVESGSVTLADRAEREALLAKAVETLDRLWAQARRATEEDARPVTSGLFVQALNEMIDAYGRRDATLERHVPEVVHLLLFGTFLVTGVVFGYASGVAGHRASFVTYAMVALIVLLVFIIIDLDRPRRGLIEVSHKSLLDLRAAIAEDREPEVLAAPQPTPAAR